MYPGYYDIRKRIDEEPTWYTVHGVPRYGEFQPNECNIYSRYSVLMEIGCQDCGKRFLIGQDIDDSRDLVRVSLDYEKYNESNNGYKLVPGDDGHCWIPMYSALYAPHRLDEEGRSIYRTTTIEEYVENWGFGDPPSHGCVGDTMGCVEIRSVQVWDKHFGQESELAEGGKYSVITKMGESARLEELENYLFEIPEWYHFV